MSVPAMSLTISERVADARAREPEDESSRGASPSPSFSPSPLPTASATRRTKMLQPTNATVHLQRPAGSSPDVAVAKEDQDKRSTKEVIDNHLGYFGERNIDGILSDYAPGAVLFTPEGPLRGVESIRGFFRAMLAEFGKPGATFKMKQLSVDGDHGFILWAAETADNVYELGTDTFVVHDGKIQVQSFAGKIAPKY